VKQIIYQTVFLAKHGSSLACTLDSIHNQATDMSGFATSIRALWNHPAGPQTIFFWAPTMKWGITAANVKDFQRPPELLSYPQQSAVALTGSIWVKYSLDITPVNYNLMSVNFVMACTGLYQLYRKYTYEQKLKQAPTMEPR